MTTITAPVMDDITLPELVADPYPAYKRLRREAPVCYLPDSGYYMVTRWDDCERIGKSDELLESGADMGMQFLGPNLQNASGAAHRSLRAGVDPPLRPRAVLGFIEELARPVSIKYVEEFAARGGSGDATMDLLELISVRVIGDVLGLDDIDDRTLQRWFVDISSNFAANAQDPVAKERAYEARRQIEDHVRPQIERLTEEPDGGSLSSMIHEGIGDGPKRGFDDIFGTLLLMIVGGFQEPGHGAANSVLGLLLNPDQLKATVEDPETWIPRAVHEGLRWIAPFGVVFRRPLEDLPVGDAVVPAGSQLLLAAGSANRDESRYDHGEDFDMTREKKKHASFGYGIHLCAGHFISRELERIALDEMLKGLPNLRLDPDKQIKVEGFFARGVKELPVLWDA